jgi:hypothetical protein
MVLYLNSHKEISRGGVGIPLSRGGLESHYQEGGLESHYQEGGWNPIIKREVGIPLIGLTPPHACDGSQRQEQDLQRHMSCYFYVQLLEVRGDCSFSLILVKLLSILFII